MWVQDALIVIIVECYGSYLPGFSLLRWSINNKHFFTPRPLRWAFLIGDDALPLKNCLAMFFFFLNLAMRLLQWGECPLLVFFLLKLSLLCCLIDLSLHFLASCLSGGSYLVMIHSNSLLPCVTSMHYLRLRHSVSCTPFFGRHSNDRFLICPSFDSRCCSSAILASSLLGTFLLEWAILKPWPWECELLSFLCQ